MRDERGRAIVWPRASLPLHIVVDPSLPAAWTSDLLIAVRDFNHTVGRDLFLLPQPLWDEGLREQVLRDDGGHIQGLVYVMPRGEDDGPRVEVADATTHGGHTILRRDTRTGVLRNAVVYLPRPDARLLHMQTVKHELGHVLGLDHDHSSRSIMFPRLADRSATLWASDVNRLRRQYG